MPQRNRGRNAGVQIWLDPDLQKAAIIYPELAAMAWQDLLEQCGRDLVCTRRARHRGKALQELATS
jgi:hypothetical protein